jgi:hypothetical protein
MKIETVNRLLPMFDELNECLRTMSGADTYEEGFAILKEEFREEATSPATWLRKKAREVYPVDPPDSVRPDRFLQILAMIDTKEKATAIFAALPEEEAPKVEDALKFILKQFLPSVRFNAKLRTKKLPQRHRGGRKSTMPPEEQCLTIYGAVEELVRKDIKRGKAQRRVADKYGLSLRMVQRICRAQKLKLRDANPDAPDLG